VLNGLGKYSLLTFFSINYLYLKLSKKFFFNSYIGAFLSGYLDISFTSLLQLSEKDISAIMQTGKVLSSILLVLTFAAPILVLILFVKYTKAIKNPLVKNRIGVLY
jgi:hypothetical protein